MEFVNIKLLVISVVVVAIFSLISLRIRNKFSKLVQSIWSLKIKKRQKISIIFYFLSFFIFAFAVGDLRGPEEVVESNIPNQRTLILIDNSMSMLVEDVRPNRISKAAIIAKHFVKNAFGHQVSLSIFSDIQRKIVPFTDDLDILESRLETMLSAAPDGGSNVSLALKEAFQYFKTSNGYTKGNILLITDGEEHGSIDVEIPEEISLGIVGVGTPDGGKIPVRDKRGNFRRYKKHNNVEIVSKLNKTFFEDLVEKSKYSKVWFIESYSLPTQEILDFFKNVHLNAFSKGSFRSRPVLGYWIIISAIISYVIFVILSRFKMFNAMTAIFIMLIVVGPKDKAFANQEDLAAQPNPYQDELVEKMRRGEITHNEKLKLAELYLKQKNGQEQSVEIYSETLSNYENEKDEDLFNYATALLKNNRLEDSLNLFDYISTRTQNNDLKKKITEQIKLALKKQEQKKKQDKKNKKDKKNKDQKDKNKDQNKDNNGNSEQKKKQGQNKDDKGQEKKKKKSGQGKEDQEKKQQSQKKDSKNGNKKEQKTKQQQWKQIESQAKRKKKMRKANGVFKQIMNDDAQLQQKFIDTSSEGDNNRKDW
ncbi:VWA domain-containing protein [Halobacteriovorax sp. DPLXC-1]|uniref:VWA domain-containing protein n=1 Tax=Halobacteriovorax sp. DPLXC-1 TaxID=3110771 RepID=UPI002FEF7411